MPGVSGKQSDPPKLQTPALGEASSRRLIAAQEEERKRLARELHDGVGQTLLVIKNRAFLASQAPNLPTAVAEQLNEISTIAMRAIEEVREISYTLRPFQLDWMGLSKALLALINKVSLAGGFRVVADIDPIDGLFLPEAEINLYRIAQEGLTNIVKHARAAVVEVRIKKLDPQLTLSIKDDGCGFDVSRLPENTLSGGLGLLGISERARILGGQLAIHSQPGHSTQLNITIPLPAPPHEKR